MEIELKLAVEPDALTHLEREFFPKLKSEVSRSQKSVFNEYYDTPEQLLGKRKMGLRVRAVNGSFEQTVKTKGQVQGGLHQRPEYNVALSEPVPNLKLFDSDIWGDDFDVEVVDKSIEKLFTTHFERTQFDIKSEHGHVELVLDIGEVKTENDSLPICEIELELKQGESHLLFNLAQDIAKLIPLRLSNTTKASRGYQLVGNKTQKIKSMPQFLALSTQDTTEEGLCKAIECALTHWQYHQSIYMQSDNAKALTEIRESLQLLLHSVSLYLPVLQSEQLLQLHKQLLKLVQRWDWQEDLVSIHLLRSKKGAFCKRIPKHQQMINYLLGRREGLFLAFKPHDLIMSELSSSIQLSASRLLVEKPWRQQSDGANIQVIKHAKGWLSQSWQIVMQSLPPSGKMDASKYLAIQALLKQALTDGFLLGDLFSESRGHFRMPWLDLLQGIEELKAISFLRSALEECEVEDEADFRQWIDEKTTNLLAVMERSREVATNAEVYW